MHTLMHPALPSSALHVLAAGAAPAFFGEVAALLVATALVAYLCHRLRILPIVSFLLTGAAIGPQALGLVRDQQLIEAAAEVGVILLLFTIGIEFSLEKLGRIHRLIFVGGGLQVGLTIAAVAGIAAGFGIDWRTGVFTGFLVALSSTAIVMKLLMSRKETTSEGGQAALGLLIFQDLAVVAMVLMVPMLGGEGGTGGELALALGKAVAIVALVLIVARRVMPRILEAVARTCSQEIFLLTVVAICFGTAYLTSALGVSLSLGAFLAGLLVSESRFSELAFGEILPLQILFSATFFVSVGLLLDLRFLFANLPLILGILVGVLVLKTLTTGLSLRLLGYGSGTLAFSSLILAQVGEFSFVLERAGREVGLAPAGLEEGGPQAFIAATVVLMIATPLIASVGERLRQRWKPDAAPGPADDGAEEPDTAHGRWQNHVIVAGYGGAGRMLARILAERGRSFVIVTLSPTGARQAESGGLPVIRGNYTRQHELRLAGAEHARLLVVADDDLETTRRVVSAARALNENLRILVRTRFASEIRELEEAGASRVLAEDQESALRLLTEVLRGCGVAEEVISRHRADLRGEPVHDDIETSAILSLSEAQRATPGCEHAALTRPVIPGAAVCRECVEQGDSWVHLRVCMSCGHVACCDSSPNRHAASHWKKEGHPIVRSFEAGEGWAWCYEDRQYLAEE